MSRAVTFRGFATEQLGEERRGALWPFWAVAISLAFFPLSVHALDITGYDATTNDRFASGFPTVPVNNSSPTFVGADYDWSGVGWSTTTAAASSYKGFGFLSPQHYLVARHYGGSTAVRLLESDGTVVEGTQQSVSNLGFGAPLNGNPDLSIGTLTAPLSTMAHVARYAVLDLYTTSTSTTSATAASTAPPTTADPAVAAESDVRAALDRAITDFSACLVAMPNCDPATLSATREDPLLSVNVGRITEWNAAGYTVTDRDRVHRADCCARSGDGDRVLRRRLQARQPGGGTRWFGRDHRWRVHIGTRGMGHAPWPRWHLACP